MDIINAYVQFCDDKGFNKPTKKMRHILRSKRRIMDLAINNRNLRTVHAARRSIARLLRSENPAGEGDKFAAWCMSRGRPTPSSQKITLMNEDPDEGRRAIHYDSDNPRIYRSLCTYMAMGGMRDISYLR